MDLKIESRQIKPAVVNLKQYSNNTYQLQYTLDTTDYGSINLKNLDAYAITSINGLIDETKLTKSYNAAGKLVLTWNVMSYSTAQIGHVDYQIAFKDSNGAVWYSLKAMLIVSETIDADDHTTANYPSILRQWEDWMNNLKAEILAIVAQYTQGITREQFTANDSRWESGGVGWKLRITTTATNVVNVYRIKANGFNEIVMVGVDVGTSAIVIESYEKFDGFVAVSSTTKAD